MPPCRSSSPPTGDDVLALPLPRVAADQAIEIFSTDFSGPLRGTLRNLSVGGVCAATASPFAVGSVTLVTLSLPARCLALPARGLWQSELAGEDSMLSGLAFDGAEPEALDVLWEFVLEGGKRLARVLFEQGGLAGLRGLGMAEAMGLAQITRSREVPAGRAIYRRESRDPAGGSIFIVLEGMVGLRARMPDGVELTLDRLEAGGLFGRVPALSELDCVECAVAETNVRLLEIDRRAFRYLRRARPWLGHRLTELLTGITSAQLREMLPRILGSH